MPIRLTGETTKRDVPTQHDGAKKGGESLFGAEPDAADTALPDHEAIASIAQSQDAQATRVVGPRRRPKPSAPGAVDAAEDDPMADPPVGWLVLVRGPGKGRVLTLGNGLNMVGRSAQMRVCIDFGDANISRNNHARIVYEPRERKYLLMHGEGTNLTYLNGELVMGPVDLISGGEIQFGDVTTVRFQAFCGKDFDWPDVDSS